MKRIFLFFLFLSFVVSPGLSVSTPIADTVAVGSVQQVIYTTQELSIIKAAVSISNKAKLKPRKPKSRNLGTAYTKTIEYESFRY